jgi:antitoxin VapB
MKKAKIFKNGQSQAVRLPKEFRLTGTEVFVQKMGDGVLLTPVRDPWALLKKSLEQFPPNALGEREQPQMQKRKSLD